MGACSINCTERLRKEEEAVEDPIETEKSSPKFMEQVPMRIKPFKTKAEPSRNKPLNFEGSSTTDSKTPQEDNYEKFFKDYNNYKKLKTTGCLPKIKKKNEICIAIYGSSETGKTTFSYRLSKRKVSESYIPSKSSENVKVTLNYTKRHHNFKFIIPSKKEQDDIVPADCYLVFFDISAPQSFIEAQQFIQFKLKGCGQPIILIGNKCDQQRAVSEEKINRLCRSKKCRFIEMSSLLNTGIMNAMHMIDESINTSDF